MFDYLVYTVYVKSCIAHHPMSKYTHLHSSLVTALYALEGNNKGVYICIYVQLASVSAFNVRTVEPRLGEMWGMGDGNLVIIVVRVCEPVKRNLPIHIPFL